MLIGAGHLPLFCDEPQILVSRRKNILHFSGKSTKQRLYFLHLKSLQGVICFTVDKRDEKIVLKVLNHCKALVIEPSKCTTKRIRQTV